MWATLRKSFVAQVLQFYRVALSAKTAEHDAALVMYRRSQPFRDLLQQAGEDLR